MTAPGLFVRMHARAGKEAAVESLLQEARRVVDGEPATTAWFAVRFGPREYGTFDVFDDEGARDAHLAGAAMTRLMTGSGELLERAPHVEKLDVLAEKVPIVSTEPDTKGLLLMFRAKPGREHELEEFLCDGKRLVSSEPATTAWFAIRTETGEYGIFDVFPGNEDRFLHLVGHLPREIAKHAFTLLGSMPNVQMLNVQAEKIGSRSAPAVY